jgi:hypothetical protein
MISSRFLSWCMMTPIASASWRLALPLNGDYVRRLGLWPLGLSADEVIINEVRNVC